jgi:hypothetical protein
MMGSQDGEQEQLFYSFSLEDPTSPRIISSAAWTASWI